jgi:hypothetical protein
MQVGIPGSHLPFSSISRNRFSLWPCLGLLLISNVCCRPTLVNEQAAAAVAEVAALDETEKEGNDADAQNSADDAELQLFEGEVDQQRLRATMDYLHDKISQCDAIIIASAAASGSGEGVVESTYIVQCVLQGSDFLQPHLQHKDFRGQLGEQTYVIVRYFEPWLTNHPLEMPDGPVVLFLRAPDQGERKVLQLYDNQRPNDGAVYATRKVIQQIRQRIGRLESLLNYFAANGFRLVNQTQPHRSRYIIEQAADGSMATTDFRVYDLDRDPGEIREELASISLASFYNPYCQIAMFHPGITGPPETPDGWHSPETLNRHMDRDARFTTLFQNYRPAGSAASPTNIEVRRFSERHMPQMLNEFTAAGITLKPIESEYYTYYVAQPETTGYQIALGIWVYPPKYSAEQIEKDLWQHGISSDGIGPTIHDQFIIWGPITTNWQLEPEARREKLKEAERIEKQIRDTFQKLKLPELPGEPEPPKTETEVQRAFLNQAQEILSDKQDLELLADDQIDVRRQKFADALARVNGTLRDDEKTRMILYGSVTDLDRAGDCWSVEQLRGFKSSIAGYLDATTGEVRFIWIVPEG